MGSGKCIYVGPECECQAYQEKDGLGPIQKQDIVSALIYLRGSR